MRRLAVQRAAALLVWLGGVAWSAAAGAHEFRPTLLRAELGSDGVHQVTWKWDGMDPRGVPGDALNFPGCTWTSRESSVDTEMRTHFTVTCGAEPLGVTFARPPIEVVVDLRLDGRPVLVQRLMGVSDRVALSELLPAASEAGAPVPVASWLRVGAEHILFGWDHLCFVVALALLVGRWRRVAGVVTGFTLGHSVTLVATTLDWIPPPSSGPIEASIALSIVYVANELVRDASARARFADRTGFVVATGFGLVHGFGFAGALSELQLPPEARGWALGAFNVGVELGQLAVVAAVLLIRAACVRATPRDPARTDAALRTVAAYLTGAVSVYWFIERTIGIVTG